MHFSKCKILECLPIVLSILLLIYPSPLIQIAAQESELTLTTDRDLYIVGGIVGFNASGMQPDSEYILQTFYHDSLIYSMEFNSTSEGSMPPEIYWNSTSSSPGTYIVKLMDVDGNIVAEDVFGLVEVNKYEFLPQESIMITGGGVEPNSKLIIIVSDGSIIFNGSVTPNEYGEFQVIIPIPFNTTYGNYQVMIYSEGLEAGPDLVFTVFVNSTLINLISIIGMDLTMLIEIVSEINTTIQQSILAKLQNALKKIEQAEHHLLLNRTHVARNMLNAAENILNACINELNAQSGKHLDNETAVSISLSIQDVMSELEVIKSSLNKPPGKQKQSNGAPSDGAAGIDTNIEEDGKANDRGNKQYRKDKHNENNGNGRGKGKGRR